MLNDKVFDFYNVSKRTPSNFNDHLNDTKTKTDNIILI